MSNLLQIIQGISVKSVAATNPASLAYGEVTQADPLEIRITENLLTIGGSTIILTESVVEKKLTIQKHTHKIGSSLAGHGHPFSGSFSGTILETPASGNVAGNVSSSNDINSNTTIVDTVLECVCSEFGEDLPVESDDDKIVITLNRGLEKGDGVIMLRLMGGQQFLVLSRIFKHCEEGE